MSLRFLKLSSAFKFGGRARWPLLLALTAVLSGFGRPLAATDPPYRQAKLKFSFHQYKEAEDLFRQDLKYNPTNGNSYFYLGYIQEKQGRRHQAIPFYRQAVELRILPDLREKALWKLILYYKYNEDWANLALYCHNFLKHYKLKRVTELLELAEKNSSPELLQRAQQLARGQKLMRAKKFAEAVPPLAEVVAGDPQHRQARWLLAEALYRIGRPEQARGHLRQLIAASPDVWQYHFKAGICDYQLKAFDSALAEFARARKLNSKPDGYFLYVAGMLEGFIRLERGAFAEARDLLLQALKHKRRPDLLAALAIVELALGNETGAARLASEALRQQPDSSDALFARGLVAARRGKAGAARRALRLLETNLNAEKGGHGAPFYPAALFELGRLALKVEDFPLAIRLFDQLNPEGLENAHADLLLRPKAGTKGIKTDYHYRFALALLGANRIDAAISHLKAIESHPESQYLLARIFAGKFDPETTRHYLLRSETAISGFWERVAREPVFQQLARHNSNFAQFMENRGRPVGE